MLHTAQLIPNQQKKPTVHTLCGLHTVHAVSAELGADNSIAAGQVDVPLASQRHAGAGQNVLLVEAGHELGQLLLRNL